MSAKVIVFDPRLDRTGAGKRIASSRDNGGSKPLGGEDESAYNMAAVRVVTDPYELLLQGASAEAIRTQVGRY
jgi:hypothetical protein